MSHLYDTIEPNIISEGLLRKCVLEQGPDGEAGRIAKEEGIDFGEVTQIRLDFQSEPFLPCYACYSNRGLS